jgi:glycosyltransferase involved in cell wall biosynthesis
MPAGSDSQTSVNNGQTSESGASAATLRTLMIAGFRGPADDEQRRQIAADEMPDDMSFKDALGARLLDEGELEALPGLYGRVLRALPFRLAQVPELIRRSRGVDVVFAWGEIPAILAAAALMFIRRPVLVVLIPWPSKPKKAIPLGLLRNRIDLWLVPSPLQHRFVAQRLRIPPERLPEVQWAVDTRFWRPQERPQDTICAVGQEMRDYPTFLEAIRPLGIPCHIAVGASIFATTSQSWYSDLRGEMPAGVTVGPKSYTELRELYARSRFVVVPLNPSDNDSGITAIHEAMAMGKALIVTESPGQVGTLVDGVNCLRVPPHDAAALRAAIEKLWNDPELCARLGAAGRARAEAEYDQALQTEAIVKAIGAIRARRR